MFEASYCEVNHSDKRTLAYCLGELELSDEQVYKFFKSVVKYGRYKNKCAAELAYENFLIHYTSSLSFGMKLIGEGSIETFDTEEWIQAGLRYYRG